MSVEVVVTVFTIMLVFSVGTVAGWILELIYRTFFSQKTLVNPGFLSGPYLPLYGFGVVYLYLFSLPEIPMYARIFLFFAGTTILELVTGEIFLALFGLRLWNYSDRKFNYKGLVCPLFSFYWTVLALLFYIFIFPQLVLLVDSVRNSVSAYWILGFYYGVFLEDIIVSFNLAARLHRLIRESAERERERLRIKLKELALERKTIDFRLFKQQVRSRGKTAHRQTLVRFFNPFMFTHTFELKDNITQYFEKLKTRTDKEESGVQ